MLHDLTSYVPAEALKIVLALLLSFFVGIEREEHKQKEAEYGFGGVRTFPLIGLVGYGLAVLSGDQLLPLSLGLAVVGGFMLLSYRHKLSTDEKAGITTEISALATYLVGALVAHDNFWIASTIAIVSVLLLELKRGLEGLTRHVATFEIATFAQFLILTVVILPIVPNQDLTRFHLNPFKIWLVVAAVSGVSYGSYVLRRVAKGRGGVFLSGVLGGAYSSTVTTVALARTAKKDGRPEAYAGAIIAASGVMYARLALLLAIFNLSLAGRLAPWFVAFFAVAVGAAFFLSRMKSKEERPAKVERLEKNPLELKAALFFAVVFVAVLMITHLAREHLGSAGLYGLGAVMGLIDVDPFILGVAQGGAELTVAAAAIAIAAASNNAIKAIYAVAFADGPTGVRAAVGLAALAAIGLLPLVVLLRG